MNPILIKIWKWMPMRLQGVLSRFVRPLFQVFVVAVVFDENKKILLAEHTYQRVHPWALPGGSLEFGEEPEEAIVREVFEETNLKIEVQKLMLIKTWTGSDYLGLYYQCRIVDGSFQPSLEVSKIDYFPLDALPDVRPSDVELIKYLLEKVESFENELA